MRVLLRSNFDVAGVFSRGEVEVQENTSLRALLKLLSERCRLDFIDPRNGQVNATDFDVVLNGKGYQFWPQGLDTPLKEGDEVQIILMPLGGG